MIPGSIIATCLWVVLVSGIGMAPRRFHKPVGLPMLLLFFPLVAWISVDLGWIWGAGLFLAGLSIFRYPARYFGLALWQKVRRR